MRLLLIILILLFTVACAPKLQQSHAYVANQIVGEYLKIRPINHVITISCQENLARATHINSFGVPEVKYTYIINENGVIHIYFDAKYFRRIGYEKAKAELFHLIEIADGVIECPCE